MKTRYFLLAPILLAAAQTAMAAGAPTAQCQFCIQLCIDPNDKICRNACTSVACSAGPSVDAHAQMAYDQGGKCWIKLPNGAMITGSVWDTTCRLSRPIKPEDLTSKPK